MHRRIVGLVALASMTGALVLSAASSASASCMLDERPMQQRIDEADLVFVGTVESLAHMNTTATFEVEEVWKGELEDEVTVIGGSGQDGAATSVDRSWSPQERYLVFPFADGDRLNDNSCSSTQPWSEDLAQYRPADAVVRVASGKPSVVTVDGDDAAAGTDDDLPGFALLVAVAVVVAGAGVWFVRRQTRA